MVYRQQKYNLLREETEGFSKLITVLSTLPSPPQEPTFHIKNIFSVIGYFDLEPNRVMDIVLEMMEQQIWNTSFLVLLKHFRKTSLGHVIGFKLSHYHESNTYTSPPGSASTADVSVVSPLNKTATPSSLYKLVATLLSSNLLDLNNLLPYLSPNISEMFLKYKEQQAELKKEITSYGVVNLSAKSAAPPPPPGPPPDSLGKDGRKVNKNTTM